MNFTTKYQEHINNLASFKIKQLKLSKEMQYAYEYKEHLIGKIQSADKQISQKQTEYHEMLMQIQSEINQLKHAFDLHIIELKN